MKCRHSRISLDQGFFSAKASNSHFLTRNSSFSIFPQCHLSPPTGEAITANIYLNSLGSITVLPSVRARVNIKSNFRRVRTFVEPITPYLPIHLQPNAMQHMHHHIYFNRSHYFILVLTLLLPSNLFLSFFIFHAIPVPVYIVVIHHFYFVCLNFIDVYFMVGTDVKVGL